MRKYKDIENLRLKDIWLTEDVVRKANVGAFEVGDKVVIQEKIDGSCASFRYLLDGNFVACSKRKILDKENNLNGFYFFCECLARRIAKNEFLCKTNFPGMELFDYNNFLIYGEWTGKRNQVIYDKNPMKKWFVFDIWDIKEGRMLSYDLVKIIADELSLDKVWEIAVINNFKNWEQITTFANVEHSAYGEMQEGIVIKNVSKLVACKQYENPIYLKIVNEEFREVKRKPNPEKKMKKEIYKKAEIEIANVVQPARIDKAIAKLKEDNIIPLVITDKDLETVFKILPKKVIEDVVKEEPELAEVYSKQINRIITRIVVLHVKSLIEC